MQSAHSRAELCGHVGFDSAPFQNATDTVRQQIPLISHHREPVNHTFGWFFKKWKTNSAKLPFAVAAFCETEQMGNITLDMMDMVYAAYEPNQ